MNLDKRAQKKSGGVFSSRGFMSGKGSEKTMELNAKSVAGGGRGGGGKKSMVANYSSIGLGFGGKDDYIGRKDSESRRQFSPNMGRNGIGKNVFSVSGARVIFLTEFFDLQLIGCASQIFIINF